MPTKYFALLLISVIAAAAVTVWIAVSVAGPVSMDQNAWMIGIPVALAAYLVWRVIAKRLE